MNTIRDAIDLMTDIGTGVIHIGLLVAMIVAYWVMGRPIRR